MVSKRDIILIGICSLLLTIAMISFQSKSFSTEQTINSTVLSMIAQSEHEIKKKIWPELMQNPKDKLKASLKFENKGEHIFIRNQADSLVFWCGNSIPKIGDQDWAINKLENKFSHSFFHQDHLITRSIDLSHHEVELKGTATSATNSSAISKLVINSNNYQKLIINGLVLSLFLLLLKAAFAYTRTDPKIGKIRISIGVLLLAELLICFLLFDGPGTSFQEINHSVLTLCGALVSLGISLIYLKNQAIKKDNLSLMIHAGISGLLIACFVKIFEIILNRVENTAFEKLDFFNLNQLLLSVSAIIGLFAIWLFFKNAFGHKRESLTFKVGKFLCLFTLYFGGAFLFNVHLPVIFALLFLGVYFLSADLFYDITEPNITWMIWWVILNSAFLSSNLYYTSVKNDILKNQTQLKSVYQKIDDHSLQQIKDQHQVYAKSSLFERIKVLPENAKLLEDDIKAFLNELNHEHQTDFSVFYFHRNGDSGMLKKSISQREFESTTNHYQQVNDLLKYDPYNKRFLLSFNQLPQFYLLSGRQVQASQDIKFGVFENYNHVYGEIPEFPNQFQEIINQDTVITSQAISHIFYKPEPGIIIYSKKTYASLLKPISLFSYIFCLSVLLLFLFTLLNSRYQLLEQIPLVLEQIKSLRLKIQLVILLLILLSFVSIAWITGYYFNTILHNNKENEITTKVVALNNALQQDLHKVYDLQSAQNIIENEIPKLAAINNTEAEYFTLDGSKANSPEQPYPYFPYFTFKYNGSDKPLTRINQDGKVFAYFPLTSQNLGLIGFIRMQNQFSAISKKESLSDFLGSILNLYVFLFLIAGAIAIAVSRSITRPLSKLSDRINSIKVGRKNEIIEWKSDDEIGELIGSYNDMVEKLDLNIELMAKTERDLAWREMAKQVAHEIKNPLTPMKLSIQYLKQAITRHPERTEELLDKTSNTLIEQIENLVGIADAFSNMATLPQANNEKIILNEVVEAVHDLFRKRDDIEIKLEEPLEEVVVYADKGHLVRILNNLVKNAIQSIPKDQLGKILIRLFVDKEAAIICVSDNGIGIPDDLKGKIFTPKFTTKSSGSGLGLAISANMIESMNGKIYFESETEGGTSFFIEIPLVRQVITILDDTNRISLD